MIRPPKALSELSKHQKVNRIFGYILFLTLFVFTFCWSAKEIRENNFIMLIFLLVFACLIFVEIILWVILYFVFKKQQLTENDKNIKKIIAQREKEELEDFKKQKH